MMIRRGCIILINVQNVQVSDTTTGAMKRYSPHP